ncbi:pilus assembly FimT family protein [Verrucomicrobiota bacterium sgz303538]
MKKYCPTVPQSPHRATSQGFSLIELLCVIGVMVVLAGLTVPAVRGMTGSSALNSGVRTFAGMLNVARSEAIARHTVVRFAVVNDWPNKTAANLRKASLWTWNPEVEQFVQLSAWTELPEGVAIEPSIPDYVRNATYAQDDGASVRGDCVLESRFEENAEFTFQSPEGPVAMRYIEFLPSGVARIPGSSARKAIFVAVPGYLDAERQLTYTARAEYGSATWAQINVDTLTGRVRVYQP